MPGAMAREPWNPSLNGYDDTSDSRAMAPSASLSRTAYTTPSSHPTKTVPLPSMTGWEQESGRHTPSLCGLSVAIPRRRASSLSLSPSVAGWCHGSMSNRHCSSPVFASNAIIARGSGTEWFKGFARLCWCLASMSSGTNLPAFASYCRCPSSPTASPGFAPMPTTAETVPSLPSSPTATAWFAGYGRNCIHSSWPLLCLYTCRIPMLPTLLVTYTRPLCSTAAPVENWPLSRFPDLHRGRPSSRSRRYSPPDWSWNTIVPSPDVAAWKL
mmetsp:Transcript_127193/g.360004  ORF Transcript_127193/g.360004 Transcript_127193/m.360004 type:complete len:270 (-) Transcript_127193:689-1498(-)